ncbi:sulfate/molybdate ABC transporter ATP-binding protein [Demequina sp. SO4-13]|uniref:sulfate/molybdate ABC transporter ATP-binding protein n=1 Tax=Demequina sp. SO4-13 TaxID=3401027 RepID=UPI003AF710C1
MLTAHVVVPARGVDAAITAQPGRTLALLGPNGSGKSTALAAIAGTLRPEGGAVEVDGRVLHDLDRTPPLWTPPRERRVALVTQGDDLFPTMSVLDNVAFGPRSRGASRADARAQAVGWLERVGLGPLSDRRPTELSGGQQRRVAIARALASGPDVLLLDEPFAGIDIEAASELRAVVRAVAGELTVVMTVHDALDAHLLAHDVAIMSSGSVAEQGRTSEVMTRPRTEFTASLAGLVLLRGAAAEGGQLVTADGLPLRATAVGMAVGDTALAAVRPREVDVVSGDRASSGTLVKDVVCAIEPRGDVVRVHGTALVADLDPARAVGLLPGAAIVFDVPPLEAYPA